jgi:hypothetical protein
MNTTTTSVNSLDSTVSFTLIFQGDGSFGSAYVQDDGVEFKEETQANGDRKGQYSYIDPTGKKITVQYTTGKNGFQVSGDHLPRASLPVQALVTPAP